MASQRLLKGMCPASPPLNSMAIRITRREGPRGPVIELHGWLTAEVTPDFEQLCGSCPVPPLVDLSQLAGADQAGLLALRQRATSGSRLEGASPYILLLLEGDGAAGDSGSERERE